MEAVESSYDYSSSFENWDTEAAVRSKPRRMVSEEILPSTIFYSPDYVPLCHHPAVVRLGPPATQALLTQALYNYMGSTAWLEHAVVNVTTARIARREFGLTLSDEMAFDARRIFTDEAYHEQISIDILSQVARVSGIRPYNTGTPVFIQRLHTLIGTLAPEMRELAETLVAVVSETSITGTLSQVPRDPRVAQPIREHLQDHARDEARHHRYFSSLLEFLWPRLSQEQKGAVGPLLPEFISIYLTPDVTPFHARLTELGMSESRAREVVEESYPRDEMRAFLRQTGNPSFKLFQKFGVLEEPCVEEAFLKAGLLP